ncbi:MAG: hypothetical protein ACTSPE_00645 [Candidatus Thorarchaeota archaeon]
MIRGDGVLLKRCRWSPVSLSMGHGGTKLKIHSLLLVVVVLSPLWMMPLSVPVFSDVVVVMHHDSAVNTAVRTITENVPDIRVVEYGSLEYAMIIHRTVGQVVWVSHGSEEGILAGSQVLSWRTFSSRTEMTPGRDIVLACESNRVSRYIAKSSVMGFAGGVDAILGGLLSSYILSATRGTVATLDNVVSKYASRLADIILNQDEPIFLDWCSDSQKIIAQAMLTMAFTLAVCITSFETVWQIVGFVSAAFTDYIVKVILAPLWAGWLAFLQPIIWNAVFAALFTGVTILTGNPFCLSSLTAIKIAILGIAGLNTLKDLVGTFITNVVLVLIGNYSNLAGTIATVVWDLITLAIVLKTNAASFILASTYIVLLWDTAGLFVDLFW